MSNNPKTYEYRVWLRKQDWVNCSKKELNETFQKFLPKCMSFIGSDLLEEKKPRELIIDWLIEAGKNFPKDAKAPINSRNYSDWIMWLHENDGKWSCNDK